MNATEIRTDHANPKPASKTRILVVEDEQTMQLLASTILRRFGYDAVVMDLALPGGISGLEATLAIKQIDARAKVIVSSGYLEQNARNAALEHGFSGILPKPYTAERLASELRWVLRSAD
jgi:CheY-like chemotaxis protein